jgi:hypothetical protein
MWLKCPTIISPAVAFATGLLSSGGDRTKNLLNVRLTKCKRSIVLCRPGSPNVRFDRELACGLRARIIRPYRHLRWGKLGHYIGADPEVSFHRYVRRQSQPLIRRKIGRDVEDNDPPRSPSRHRHPWHRRPIGPSQRMPANNRSNVFARRSAIRVCMARLLVSLVRGSPAVPLLSLIASSGSSCRLWARRLLRVRNVPCKGPADLRQGRLNGRS